MNIRDRITAIKSVTQQREELYAILDELVIKYKRTRCVKCLMDYLAIAKEAAGMICSAADESGFNGGRWVYTRERSVRWNGRIYGKHTPQHLIAEFAEVNEGYYVFVND